MNYYISDTHLGHEESIGPTWDNRPFKNVFEMDEKIIKNWNNTVNNNDNVYILGDFAYTLIHSDVCYYLEQLKGKKHLLIGNHEEAIMENEKSKKYFESIQLIKEIEDNGKKIVLCHFPIAEWNGYDRNYWHIYGHVHNCLRNSFGYLKNIEKALNAGCMINNYKPATFEELVINNKIFKENNNPI